MPNRKFYRGRKQATTNLFFSLQTWVRSSRNQLQGNSRTLSIFSKLDRNKRDKDWKTGIHFKSDVFAAVAVVDAKAPYLLLRRAHIGVHAAPKYHYGTLSDMVFLAAQKLSLIVWTEGHLLRESVRGWMWGKKKIDFFFFLALASLAYSPNSSKKQCTGQVDSPTWKIKIIYE